MLLIYQIHEDVQVMADYIADPVKTSFVQNNEKINLVSTVNCSVERLGEEFDETRKQFSEYRNVRAVHFMQVFRPGDADPVTVHETGLELSKKLFGESYQFIVGTHTDTEKPHNHILVNICDMYTGRKILLSRESTDRMKELSDRIFKERGFQIIEKTGNRRYQDDMFYRILFDLKSELDYLCLKSFSLNEIIEGLKRSGYSVFDYPYEKFLVVQCPKTVKPVHLKYLGDEYSKNNLEKRLKKGFISVYPVSVRNRMNDTGYSLRKREDWIRKEPNPLYRKVLECLLEIKRLPGYCFNPKRFPAGSVARNHKSLMSLKEIIKRDRITKVEDLGVTRNRILYRLRVLKIIYPIFKTYEKVKMSIRSLRSRLINEMGTIDMAPMLLKKMDEGETERKVERY